MYTVTVSRDNAQQMSFDCDALCISYLSNDEIKSCVCVSPETNMQNVPLMACACSESALSVIKQSQNINNGPQCMESDKCLSTKAVALVRRVD